MNVLATVIIGFILFGAFLTASGAGKAFIDLALAVAGRFRGGPAKVAILASALFGMVNGSALANVATTGTITIPLMKSIGYKPTFAGAVEAVASTGGPMTPPVMGASIFIMMDFLGVSYVKLMLVALVPAFLYYLGLFIMVDHEAVKGGLKGLSREQIPSLKKTLNDAWFCLVPIVVILFLLVFLHYSPATAAMAAIVSLVLASMLKKGYRMGPRKLANALAGSSAGLPEVGTGIAIAGILMGAFNITGIGITLSRQLVALAGGNLTLLAVITAIACLIFGMGISGVAVYLLGAIFMVPGLTLMGVNPIAAHFFVLWMAHAALITPPVCGAAFLAGAIADAPLMATGWQASRLGIVVYLMSVFWVYDPALLLVGSPGHIALAIVTAIAGVYCASCAVAGRMFRLAGWVERTLLLAGAILLFVPNLNFSLIGLAAVAPVIVWQVIKVKAAARLPQASA
jgi:TRAP transporter 4TM/12TM fusion protein